MVGAQVTVGMSDELDVSIGVPHATTRVNDAYCANPDIDSLLASDFWGPVDAGPLVVNEGRRGEKVVGGFGLSESTIDWIQNGTITYTVGRSPTREAISRSPSPTSA